MTDKLSVRSYVLIHKFVLITKPPFLFLNFIFNVWEYLTRGFTLVVLKFSDDAFEILERFRSTHINTILFEDLLHIG